MDINAVRKRLSSYKQLILVPQICGNPKGKTQIRIVPYKLQKDTPFICFFIMT